MAGKADMVDKIADLTGMPKTHVAMCYDRLFELMGETLGGGEKVAVPNFGTFQVSERPARKGRTTAPLIKSPKIMHMPTPRATMTAMLVWARPTDSAAACLADPLIFAEAWETIFKADS